MKPNSKLNRLRYIFSGAFIFFILGYYWYSYANNKKKSIRNQINKKHNQQKNEQEININGSQSNNMSSNPNHIHTKIWKIPSINKLTNKAMTYSDYLSLPAIKQAGAALKNGHLVGFPTETVYGLGANAYSNDATGKIFIAKGRPSDNPLIVHISEISQLYEWILKPLNNNYVIPPILLTLMKSFWPGPLSIIFEYNCDESLSMNDNTNVICPSVRGNGRLKSIAVRMPSNLISRALITSSLCPIAAPSANISGKPSPTNSSHVIYDMNGKIYGILDCGEIYCDIGLESTIIKYNQNDNNIIILRPGGITKQMMYNVIKKDYVGVDIVYSKDIKNNDNDIVEAPGMKYRHYAPNKPLYLVSNPNNNFLFQDIYNYYKSINEINNIIFIITKQNILYENQINNKNILIIGEGNNLNEIASNVFKILRKIDDNKEYENIKLIFSEIFELDNIGVAIMNRLNKASQSNKIIKNINDLKSIEL